MSWDEAGALAWLAGAAIKSTALLGAAWMVTRAMTRRPAAERHAVWTAAFAAVLLLPLLTAALPGLRAPGLSNVLPSAAGPLFQATVSASGGSRPAVASSGALSAVTPPAIRLGPMDWRAAVLLLWAAGAAWMLMRTAWACVWMTLARRKAKAFPAACGEVETPEGVRVVKAESGSMPMVSGVLRPVVFLPADALLWDGERRRMVLEHEFAHVRRGDLATHFVGRIGLSLWWWNPMAWKAWGEFLKERERAADDLVLRTGARASSYAAHLLEIARGAQRDRAIGVAALAMARPAQLEGRLMAILDGTTNHGAPRRVALVAAAAAALAFTLPVAALRAQDPTQTRTASDLDATLRVAASSRNYQGLDDLAARLILEKDFDGARRVEDEALALRQAQAGARSAVYAQGLLRIADLELARNNHAEAMKFYEQAANVGTGPELFKALMALGLSAYRNHDAAMAASYLQRAENASSAPELQARALLMMAQVDLLDAGGPAEAAAHYRAAINMAPADSGQRIAAENLFARFLETQGRVDEAATLRGQAGEALKALKARVGNGPMRTSEGPVTRVDNGTSSPVVLYHPEPEYSEEARAAKYQGSVTMSVVIAPTGAVQDVAVLQPLGLGLDEQAMQAVSRWNFKPAMKDGQPVAVTARIEVNFKLL